MRDSAPAILLVLLAAATGCSDSTGPTKAIQPTITAGASHSCLLSRTGAASCWGDNGWGELGTDPRRVVPGQFRFPVASNSPRSRRGDRTRAACIAGAAPLTWGT